MSLKVNQKVLIIDNKFLKLSRNVVFASIFDLKSYKPRLWPQLEKRCFEGIDLEKNPEHLVLFSHHCHTNYQSSYWHLKQFAGLPEFYTQKLTKEHFMTFPPMERTKEGSVCPSVRVCWRAGVIISRWSPLWCHWQCRKEGDERRTGRSDLSHVMTDLESGRRRRCQESSDPFHRLSLWFSLVWCDLLTW